MFKAPLNWEMEEDGTYISEDGSKYDANGKYIPFTKVDVEHPGNKRNDETHDQYRERVDKQVELGFHLGDLSWSQWHTYCYREGEEEYKPSSNDEDDF